MPQIDRTALSDCERNYWSRPVGYPDRIPALWWVMAGFLAYIVLFFKD